MAWLRQTDLWIMVVARALRYVMYFLLELCGLYYFVGMYSDLIPMNHVRFWIGVWYGWFVYVQLLL